MLRSICCYLAYMIPTSYRFLLGSLSMQHWFQLRRAEYSFLLYIALIILLYTWMMLYSVFNDGFHVNCLPMVLAHLLQLHLAQWIRRHLILGFSLLVLIKRKNGVSRLLGLGLGLGQRCMHWAEHGLDFQRLLLVSLSVTLHQCLLCLNSIIAIIETAYYRSILWDFRPWSLSMRNLSLYFISGKLLLPCHFATAHYSIMNLLTKLSA
jgi:hypothetical protein